MAATSEAIEKPRGVGAFLTWGMFWLVLAIAGAFLFFRDGIDTLLNAWQRPEYSHGPLIPILSGLMFLRQLKSVPVDLGTVTDRWPGVLVILASLALGTAGMLANIGDVVAYALILWVAGIILVSFGWSQGAQFWPPVLHLVFMLPLPDVLYYKVSAHLQLISSQIGVWFLDLLRVPVHLDGNIIDLGVYKLHVAEACSGLRYLFPILSFSYIFAVLYRGPGWHKAVLLLSAAPITVLMNSVRIAVAGVLSAQFGTEWLEGFTHFFEGWVIFVACIVILFGLAWVLLQFQKEKMSLAEALDLEVDGLGAQAMRVRFVEPSAALISTAGIMLTAFAIATFAPERQVADIERDPFMLFPRQIGEWSQAGPAQVLEPRVEASLKADDYHSVDLVAPDAAAQVGLFMAWYADQSRGGVHSPEICLPGSGWEIAWLERVNIADDLGSETPFNINRAIIQRGETRMMVYYWFEQKGRKVAWDFAARYHLLMDGITKGRTDGALVRLTTPILEGEPDEAAAERLNSLLRDLEPSIARFIPQS